MIRRVDGRILRFRPNGGRVQQDIRSLKGHGPGCLGKPLIPAYGNPHSAHFGLEYFESSVSGSEIELFLVARAIRDVALACSFCSVRRSKLS